MAFVNEKGERMPRTDYRTIDYDRNIILKRGGHNRGHSGRSPRPELGDPIKDYFILTGDDFQIRFEGHLSGEDAPKGKRDINWNIFCTWDAQEAEGREQEIADIIAEAMTAYGVYFGKKNVRNTTITFDKNCRYFSPIAPIDPVVTPE